MTEFKYGNDKKAYLSAVLDLYGRNIAGFSFGHSNNNELVFATFKHALTLRPIEGFWGILKTEMYYLFQFETYEVLEAAIYAYMDFYNNRRYQKRTGLHDTQYVYSARRSQ